MRGSSDKEVPHCVVCSCSEPELPTSTTLQAVAGTSFSLLAALVACRPAVASAANGFTERVASALWSIPFQCPDGYTAADGRLIVETDDFIEAGTGLTPLRRSGLGSSACVRTARSAGASYRAAPTQLNPDLKAVSVTGTFVNVQDNRGVLPAVSSTPAGPGPDGS